jgi:hypothetical protein
MIIMTNSTNISGQVGKPGRVDPLQVELFVALRAVLSHPLSVFKLFNGTGEEFSQVVSPLTQLPGDEKEW